MKLLMALLLVGSIAHAESKVKFDGKKTSLSGVDVFETAQVGETKLTKTGEGVRKKTKIFVFNLYTAVSYVSDLTTFKKEKGSVKGLVGQTKVLRLTMLRDLGVADIKASFKVSLEANDVDVEAKEVKAIFESWKDDVKKGDTITLISLPHKDGEELFIEVGDKVLTSVGKDLGVNFWKIWFGKGDSWIMELQKQLIGKE